MCITDDLREWWVRKFPVMDKELHEDFTAIADRIDEKHYDAQADAYDNGVNYVFNNPTLFGLMPLPRDADGQYIHIGDMMECEKLPNGNRVCGEVKAISNDCVWLINVQYKIHAKYLRHHREPTIEDVLQEFALEIDPSADIAVTGAETIKKFAAKLQLKETE